MFKDVRGGGLDPHSERLSRRKRIRLRRLTEIVTLEDVLEEERKEREKEKELAALREDQIKSGREYAQLYLEQKNRKKADEKLERRLMEFVACFGNEFQQIAFRALCYNYDPSTMAEIKDTVKKVIGPKNNCPDTYREYLIKFAEHGFAEIHPATENLAERYSPTRKGIFYGLPGVMRMMDWEVAKGISSFLLVGLSRAKKDGGYYSMRLKLLKLLAQDPNKKWTRASLERKLNLGNKSLMHHIEVLKKNGLISYVSAKVGRDEIGRYKWDGKSSRDLDAAKRDGKLRLYPKIDEERYKNSILEIFSRSEKGMNYKEIVDAIGWQKDPRYISTFLADLFRLGYASSRWKADERRSEAQIRPLGFSYVSLLNKIKNSPLKLRTFQRKESLKDFREKARIAEKIYLPYSRTYQVWLAKKPALVDYLSYVGEASADQIYRDTPIKQNMLLKVGLFEGTLKVRKERVLHGPIPYQRMVKVNGIRRRRVYHLGGSHYVHFYSLKAKTKR